MKTYVPMWWPVALSAALLLAPGIVRAQVSTVTVAAPVDPDEFDDPLNFKLARPKQLIGPRMAINRNYHTGGFRTLDGASCPKFESGTGWGYAGGITAEFAGGATWSIVPAITRNTTPAKSA